MSSVGLAVLSLLDLQPVLLVSLAMNAALLAAIFEMWLGRSAKDELQVEGASLRLQFFGGHRHPVAERMINVDFWIAHYSPIVQLQYKDHEGKNNVYGTPKCWFVVIAFEKLTEVTQIEVFHNAGSLPPYNITYCGKNGCALIFNDDIPVGCLEVNVRHN